MSPPIPYADQQPASQEPKRQRETNLVRLVPRHVGGADVVDGAAHVGDRLPHVVGHKDLDPEMQLRWWRVAFLCIRMCLHARTDICMHAHGAASCCHARRAYLATRGKTVAGLAMRASLQTASSSAYVLHSQRYGVGNVNEFMP
jgi:hypothetical protein